ncbi:hypothetical protein QVD17_38470 [Tagetes erecta]|uniref:Uncharacterized protein n=1 Tax=Tagetes erecta TaxID=13708 RepID=A0AAD8NFG2_TARER|nr:hypothetical protein QVD17_38470 [Tagetes erecta]
MVIAMKMGPLYTKVRRCFSVTGFFYWLSQFDAKVWNFYSNGCFVLLIHGFLRLKSFGWMIKGCLSKE